jgi:hypothetical protein
MKKSQVTKKQAEFAYNELCALYNAGQLAHDDFLRMAYNINQAVKHLNVEFYHTYSTRKQNPLKSVCVALAVIVAVYTVGALGFWASLSSFSF